jgi:hypothetical protein
MPTSTHTKSRAAVTTTTAARSLASALGLADAGRAGVAALLVAAEEVEQNSHFAARVRAAYDLLPASKPTRRSTGAGDELVTKILSSTLTPIRHVEGREINLAAPLDPYFLLEVYGAGQLRQALDLFPLAKLKEGLPAVMERNPGTKPANRSSKGAVVDYMMQKLTAGV